MNGHQITDIIAYRPDIQAMVRGIIPLFVLDHINIKLPQIPCIFIVHTSLKREDIGHWTVVYFKSDIHCEFFCSFGREPSYYSQTLERFLFRHSLYITSNKSRLQSGSINSCGLYCLWYIYCIANGQNASVMHNAHIICPPSEMLPHYVRNVYKYNKEICLVNN